MEIFFELTEKDENDHCTIIFSETFNTRFFLLIILEIMDNDNDRNIIKYGMENINQ